MTAKRRPAQADPWALARKKLTPLQAMEQVWGEFFTPASDWAAWRLAIADAYGLPS